jgi:predicted lipoprotein with Yx(FWY)xxD motif
VKVGAVAVAVALATLGIGPAAAGDASAASTTTPTGVEISTTTTPFGTALVIGSGKFAGYTLYYLTFDHGTTYGCTSTPVNTAIGSILCAGPSGDNKAEWPGLTTVGTPVAGPGVTQSLLGTVKRSFGTQVTYAGHPLYLFDTGPGEVTGQDFDEPDLPPWHGIWYLMSPSGQPLPWTGTLTTMDIAGETVLASQMLTLDGWVNFPVYSFSNDTPKHSACGNGACARQWPAVLTSGTPGVTNGVSAAKVSTLVTPQGNQVTYNGQLIYLYAFEKVTVTSNGIFQAQGNGNGVETNFGTWNLVTP